MEERYLVSCLHGRWAISRKVGDEWLALIENTPIDESDQSERVLRAIGIPPTYENLDRYFPHRKRMFPTEEYGRSPTLELLELFAELGNEKKSECGV